jgi:hypothetical protein
MTIVKQEASAAAVGGIYALLFLLSGSLMMVGTGAITALGLGPFLSILAALHVCLSLAAFIQIVRQCSTSQDLPDAPLFSRQGSAAFLRSACRVVSTPLSPHACTAATRDRDSLDGGKDVEAPAHSKARADCACAAGTDSNVSGCACGCQELRIKSCKDSGSCYDVSTGPAQDAGRCAGMAPLQDGGVCADMGPARDAGNCADHVSAQSGEKCPAAK